MVFFIGILVSFLGQLPIGYINLIAVKIATEKSAKQAIYFGIGVAIIELIYLEVILYCISILLNNNFLFKAIQLTTALVFLIASFLIIAKWKNAKQQMRKTNLSIPSNGFFNGVFLSATNFAQVPFWVLCVSYLIETKILVKTNINYQLFVWGTGFGTLLGIMIYIFMGKKFLNKHKPVTQYLDLIIAFFLIIAAGFQISHFLKTIV